MTRAEALGDQVRQAARESTLPDVPDEDALNDLCAEIVESVLR